MEKCLQPNIQTLETLDDLDLLMRGDVVPIIFENVPVWRYGREDEFGAYHGRSHTNQLQFVVPMESCGEYIVMYRARKSQIQVKEEKIILSEDQSSTESFSPSQQEYLELNRTLQIACLRR